MYTVLYKVQLPGMLEVGVLYKVQLPGMLEVGVGPVHASRALHSESISVHSA